MTTTCFSTSDLSLAATLITVGYSFHGIDKDNPQKVVFLIEKDVGIDKSVQEYFAYKLRVEPFHFFSALRNLKSRIRT